MGREFVKDLSGRKFFDCRSTQAKATCSKACDGDLNGDVKTCTNVRLILRFAGFVAAIVAVSAMLGGCQSRGEVQRRLVVHAIGIDALTSGSSEAFGGADGMAGNGKGGANDTSSSLGGGESEGGMTEKNSDSDSGDVESSNGAKKSQNADISGEGGNDDMGDNPNGSKSARSTAEKTGDSGSGTTAEKTGDEGSGNSGGTDQLDNSNESGEGGSSSSNDGGASDSSGGTNSSGNGDEIIGYTVSYQVFTGGDTSSSGPVDASESTVITLSAPGKTLYEAQENLRLQTGKEIFLGDVELIVIGEDLMGEDIVELLSYFRDTKNVYLGVSVVYCRGKASETLGRKLNQGSATAQLLSSVITSAVNRGRACSSNIIDIYNDLYEDNAAICMPILNMIDNSGSDQKKESDGGKEGSGSDSGGSDSENSDNANNQDEETSLSDIRIGIYESAMVNKGGRQFDIVNTDAVSGIRLLRGNLEDVLLTFDTGIGSASIEAHDLRINRKVEIANGFPKIDVEISGKYRVRSSPEGIGESELKAMSEKEILRLCELGYDAAAARGADTYDIGKLLCKYESRYYYAQKDNLEEVVKSSQFDVTVGLAKY